MQSQNPCLLDLAEQLGTTLKEHHLLLSLAESCTGGGIAQAITDVAGSSAWFDCGFVTYSNHSKHHLLGVSNETLSQYGAVSMQTALEMAKGALKRSQAHIALAVTGIAGPSGGSADKPVGCVYLAWANTNGQSDCRRLQLSGSRLQIRSQVTEIALEQIKEIARIWPDQQA